MDLSTNSFIVPLGTACASVLVTYFTLKNTDQMALRKELWGEIKALKDQLKEMQSELDKWREKYSDMKIENGALSVEVKTLKVQMEYVQDQWKNLDADGRKSLLIPMRQMPNDPTTKSARN